MQQQYGPFRLLAGQHQQDVPSGIVIKVKAVEHRAIIGDDGKRYTVADASRVLVGQVRHSIYRGDVKIATGEVNAGDTLDLCHQMTYGAASVPTHLRRPGVSYDAPFMSFSPLDELHNKPMAIKFVKALDLVQAGETAARSTESPRSAKK
jgi:hypothetical protein